MRKILYERQIGKQMHASGSWKTTPGEQRLVKAVSAFFAVSVIALLASPFVQRKWFLILSVVCCAVAFISVFVVLFCVVIRKNRQEPMEMHYYDVDYRYDGIRGETDDKTREITKEEFLQSTETEK